jgi:hypothetical protein
MASALQKWERDVEAQPSRHCLPNLFDKREPPSDQAFENAGQAFEAAVE